MLIQVLWLLIILSFEATIGMPLFFLFLSQRFFWRLGERAALFAPFLIGLLLALFYNLSWPLISALFLAYYFAKVWLAKQPVALFALFIATQVVFFFLADLDWHYYYLLHLAVFLWYFVKFNLRKYAS